MIDLTQTHFIQAMVPGNLEEYEGYLLKLKEAGVVVHIVDMDRYQLVMSDGNSYPRIEPKSFAKASQQIHVAAVFMGAKPIGLTFSDSDPVYMICKPSHMQDGWNIYLYGRYNHAILLGVAIGVVSENDLKGGKE